MIKKPIIRLLNIITMLSSVLVISCGGDDEGDTPSLPDLTTLAGDWIDESVALGSDNSGFIGLTLDATEATGVVFAATANDALVSCETILFRNIQPVDLNTMNAEGFLSSSLGTEYVPVTLTIIDDNTINVEWECTSCTPGVDVLSTVATRSAVVPIEISRNIDQETTLYDINCNPDEPDYVVTELIDVQEHLTIMPGVVIAFEANAGLDITDVNANGSLSAVGTDTDRIIFTGIEKEAGFWRGLSFESNDVRNRLEWVRVEYAGSDPIVTYAGVALRAAVAVESEGGFDGSLSIANSTISNTTGNGLIVEQSGLLREFEANTFISNSESALRIDANNVGVLTGSSDFMGGSDGSGTNGFNGVEINASGSPIHDITNDATWPALANNAVYKVVQSFDVQATLTIQPGAVIEFEANETMYFRQDFSGPNDGILIAKGTSDEPITFTGAVKTAGYWRGLVIQSNSLLNEIDHCIVEYGGSDVVANESANIVLDKDGAFTAPDLIVTNSTIRHSAGCGIIVDSAGGNLTQSGNTFTDNLGSTSPDCFK